MDLKLWPDNWWPSIPCVYREGNYLVIDLRSRLTVLVGIGIVLYGVYGLFAW